VSNEALERQEQDAIHNTVEIIPMGENESGEKDPVISTRIRTYPPPHSNTSKSNRGQNPLYASSSASSGSNNQKAVECVVKGGKEFQFSQVFGPESSQEELYKSIAVPLVEGLFPKPNADFVAGDKTTGHSALLFSYGITNAGKTFTMMGDGSKLRSSSDTANAKVQKFHGIIPRTIDHILKKIDELNSQSKTNGVRYSLNMSHLEIYNEDIYDLLPQKKTLTESNKYGRSHGNFDTENKKLQLRGTIEDDIYVEGLTKHRVTTLLQGLELSQAAKKKRHTSSNNIHADSSRSHSICQFELHATRDVNGSNEVNGSKEESSSITTDEAAGYGTDDDSIMSVTSKPKTVRFWVVDLAGSERSKRTEAFSHSTMQKEASLINSSLIDHMTCLRTLKQNQSSNSSRSMVPFRDSKLTHLLMGHLTGHSASQTRMIVNINPSAADFDETQLVLNYADDARSFRIEKPVVSKKRKQNQMDNVEDVSSDKSEVVSHAKKYVEATDRIATLEKENKSLQVKANDAFKKMNESNTVLVKVQEELEGVKILKSKLESIESSRQEIIEKFEDLKRNYKEAVMQVKDLKIQLHETKSTSEQQNLELKSMLKARNESILNLHGRLETFNEDLTKAEGEIEVRLAVTNDEGSDVVDELDFGDENDDENEGQLSRSDDEEKQHDSESFDINGLDSPTPELPSLGLSDERNEREDDDDNIEDKVVSPTILGGDPSTAPQSPAIPDSIVGGTIVSVVRKVVRKKKEKKERKKRTCQFQLPNGTKCPIPETCSGRGKQLSCVLIKVHREKERVVPKEGQRIRTCQFQLPDGTTCPIPETCRGRGKQASCVLNVKNREKGNYPEKRKSAMCSVCNKEECRLGPRKKENCLEWGKVPP
jgi:hypothetical protein